MSHISAEQILIQLASGSGVPETAGIGRNLVGQYNLVVETPKFQFKINQGNVKRLKEIYKELIDFISYVGNLAHFFGGGEPKGINMRAVYKGIAQLVVFIVIFKNGFGHACALGQTKAL